MEIEKVEILHLKLPFRTKFKHSLKSRIETENIIVRIYSGSEFGIGESLPREYVTNESPFSVISTLENKIIPYFKNLKFNSFEDVLISIDGFLLQIEKNELSAFSAFEQALLNLSSKIYDTSIEDVFNYLKIRDYKKKDEVEFSAIIGIDSKLKLISKAFLIKFLGFKHLKLKISSQNLNNIRFIRKILKDIDLRVDANGCVNYKNFKEITNILKKNNISLIEQPFNINDENRFEIYKHLFVNNIKVILDESLCLFDDVKKFNYGLKKEGDIAMIRISKNGGIINSLKIYKYCIDNSIHVILGCLVGETVLTRYNLILSQYLKTIENEGDYDRFLFKKPIFNNPNFNKKGIFKNNQISINFKDNINNDYKLFIVSSKLF